MDNIIPIYMWCCILNQVQITINLLQSSRKKTKLLAYAHLFRTSDLNETPMAPSGTKVIEHKNQTNVLNGSNMRYQGGILA